MFFILPFYSILSTKLDLIGFGSGSDNPNQSKSKYKSLLQRQDAFATFPESVVAGVCFNIA
jgi:hypothetical protein